MRILLIASAYNGLCQRVHMELAACGHALSVALALNPDEMRTGVRLFQPELIVCPYLKEKVPDDIWRYYVCLIVHPGIQGDRGPSSLDWAIMNGEAEWGVTVLQAVEEMDAGPIWAEAAFPMRQASKAGLYRQEVTEAAVTAVLLAVRRFQAGGFRPETPDAGGRGRPRPLMTQSVRRIDWQQDSTALVLDKINAADSAPGVLDSLFGQEYYLYGAHRESRLRGGRPGDVIARRHGAICRSTVDGAVWISHLKRKPPLPSAIARFLRGRRSGPDFKLPAARLLKAHLENVPESRIDLLFTGKEATFREIWYEEESGVGCLFFEFHNGAMTTEQCRRLLQAYKLALARPTKVLALMGGRDFWSNGIHLNGIEAADNPVKESWLNINAMDDFVYALLTTENKLTVAAVWGGCGAGGAMAILAADYVWAQPGAVFNPHYRSMGLYGSEYWTYTLPKRVGPAQALELTGAPLPLGAARARAIGYVDDIVPGPYEEFVSRVKARAASLAHAPDYSRLLENKRFLRYRDERSKPLAAYRDAELKKMKNNFAGRFEDGELRYPEARSRFVRKLRPSQTPLYLAKHLRYDKARLSELWQPAAYQLIGGMLAGGAGLIGDCIARAPGPPPQDPAVAATPAKPL